MYRNMLRLVLLLALGGVHLTQAGAEIDELPSIHPEFEEALRRSAWNMYTTLNPMNRYENFVFSPLSIQHVVGMILAGAKQKTADQIIDLLQMNNANYDIFQQFRIASLTYFSGMSEIVYPTKLGNRVYIARGFTPKRTYIQTLRESFMASYGVLDTSNPAKAAEEINEWVSENTNGMIPRIAEESDITSLTNLVLANAIYFEASWQNAFKLMNEPISWYTDRTNFEPVQGMQTSAEFYYIDESSVHSSGMQYFAIPYDTRKIEVFFIIAVPKRRYPRGYYAKGNGESLKGFDEYVSRNLIKGKLPALRRRNREANPNLEARHTWSRSRNSDILKMPIFKMDATINAVDMLKKMGVVDMFDVNKSNLTGIINNPPLYISQFKHMAKIDVDEKGTKAAAATIAVVTSRSFNPNSGKVFTVDQPFFFGIYQNKNFIFMGNYFNPV